MRRVLPMKLLLAVLLAACVTVNVYFPAAAAQQAADQIIDTVTRGQSQNQSQNQGSSQGSNPRSDDKQGSSVAPAFAPVTPDGKSAPASILVVALGKALYALVPAAHAQGAPNLEVNTPEIRAITASMAERYSKLKPFFDSGAIGYTRDGHIDVCHANEIPLAQRAQVKGLISEDNRDRDALYAEIAKANGHPEWKDDIQNTFARRWIDRAEPGTWFQDAGGWKQK